MSGFLKGIRVGSGLAIERHTVGVADAGAAEEIEGGTDGQVHATLTDAVDGLEIFDGACSAGVGGGQGRPVSDFLDQPDIDAGAEAFDIDGVDEELGAEGGEGMEGIGTEGDFGEVLPAVGDHPVLSVAEATAEVEDDAGSTDETLEGVETIPIDPALMKDPGGDDDVGCTGIEPGTGIVGMDTAAVLEAAGPGAEGLVGGGFVAGAEGDDMAALELVLAIELGEPGWGLIGFEAGADALTGIGEGTTHDLDDASTAEIDAGSEHGVKLRGRAMAH